MALGIDKQLQNAFPGLRVVELEMRGLQIREREESLEAFKIQIQKRIKESFRSLDEIRDRQIFRSYRDFFWRVGIDPTRTRPAAEALTRRIVAGKDLPRINTFVDSYNLASIMTSIAIAAFDLERVSSLDLWMRKGGREEKFLGIGMDSPIELKGVEVVIEDLKSHRLIAIYPYRDSDDSKVTNSTKKVLLMMCGVPGISLDQLESAAILTREYVERFCI